MGSRAKKTDLVPHAAIRNAIRKLWWFGPTRRSAIKAARISPGAYLCSGCVKAFKVHEIDVDHVEPVGATPGSRLGKDRSWDEFMRRLFCPVEGLRVLCKGCHQEHTRSFNPQKTG